MARTAPTTPRVMHQPSASARSAKLRAIRVANHPAAHTTSSNLILLDNVLRRSSASASWVIRQTSHEGRSAHVVCHALPASIPRPVRSYESVYAFYTDESSATEQRASPKQLPRNVEGAADDPRLHNPLQRMERLGTGWMGVILELDGVVVEDTSQVEARAWLQLAAEEGKPAPLQFALKRALGMKAEQVVQEVLCWTRNPAEARRLATRKEALFLEALGERKPMLCSGIHALLDTLHKNNVPVALVSSAPEQRVHAVLRETGTEGDFETTICAEDVHRGRPDPEGLIYASQRIARPPARCVVIGNSNQSVEAAHEVGMQCITVAGRTPVYELTAADLVVRQLGDLSFVNLKQLFRMEDTVAGMDGEDELQLEEEDDAPSLPTTTATLDW